MEVAPVRPLTKRSWPTLLHTNLGQVIWQDFVGQLKIPVSQLLFVLLIPPNSERLLKFVS